MASRANRSKGARGPEEWKPRDEDYWCQYAQDWTEIKERWDLTMTEPEGDAVVEMLQKCEDPPDVEVWEALGTATGEHKPEPTEGPEGVMRRGLRSRGTEGAREPRGRDGVPGRIGPQRQGRRRGWGGM